MNVWWLTSGYIALFARDIKLTLFYTKQDGNKSDKAINVLPNEWSALPLYNFTIYETFKPCDINNVINVRVKY